MNGHGRFIRGNNYSLSTDSGTSWSSENSLSQTVNILQPTDSYDNLLPVNGAEIRQFRQREKLKYKKPAPVDWSSRLDRLVSGWEQLKQSNFNTDDMTVNWANMISLPDDDDHRPWQPYQLHAFYDDPEGGNYSGTSGAVVRSSQDPHPGEYSDDGALVYTKLPAEPIYPKTYEDLMAVRLANNEPFPVTTKHNVGDQNAYKSSKKKLTPGMDLTFGEKRNRSQPIVKRINVNVDVAKNKAAAVKKSTQSGRVNVADKSTKAKLGAKQNPPRLEKGSSVAKPKFPPAATNSKTIKKINK